MKKRNWCGRIGQGILCLVLFWMFSMPVSAESFGSLVPIGEEIYAFGSGYGGDGSSYCVSPGSIYYYESAAGELCTVNVCNGNLKVLVFEEDGRVKNIRSISLPLPQFGGYYHGSDGNHYVAVGQNNPQELENLVVCKILKFNSSWTLLGTADIPGRIANSSDDIYGIFSCSQARMTLYGNYLICYTGRTMFVHDDGLHHQSDITFVIDTRTMTLADHYSQPYNSHSFAQFVQTDGKRVYFLSHGDAYPRAVQLSVFDNYMTENTGRREEELFSLMGGVGETYTGTTVNGFELGSRGNLVTGISVPHGNAVEGTTGYKDLKKNLYLIVTSQDGSNASFRWLTEYTAQDNVIVGEPRLLKLSGDRFAILFQETRNGYPILRYLLVDSQGTVLAKRNYIGLDYEAKADPIYHSGKILWMAQGEDDRWRWEYIPYTEQSGSGVESATETFIFSQDQNSRNLPVLSYDPDKGANISFQISDGDNFEISNGKVFFKGSSGAAAELTFSNGSETVTIPCIGVIMNRIVLREGETMDCVPALFKGQTMEFSVENPAVASISKEGIVTGLSQGITRGTMEVGEASLDFRIYVRKELNQEITEEGEISSNYMTEEDYGGGIYTGITIGSTYRISYDLSNSSIKENYQQNGRFILSLDSGNLLNEEYRNYRLEGETDFAELGLADGQYNIWIMATLKDQPGRYRGIRTVTLNWRNGVVSMADTVNLSDSRVAVSQIPDMKYTGEYLEPDITITYRGKKLVKGRDYQVSYENNLHPGEADIFISGMGSFTGYRMVNFQILKASGSSSQSADFRKRQVQGFRSYKSSATAVYLKWSRIPVAQRYVISARIYGKGKYVTVKTLNRGTAVSAKITRLKKGATIKSGTAYQFRITAQKKINGKWVSSKTASLIVRTSPKTPVLTGVSSGKKTIKVKWRKVTGANGYQIYLSQKSKSGFKRAATLKKGSTVSKTLKKLKSGKRYYVKIRSFKKVRGRTVYSSFSKVKGIRVK